jgi:hypothetical protein
MISTAAVLDEAREATPQGQPVPPLAPLPLLRFYARKAVPSPRTRLRHEPTASRDTRTGTTTSHDPA